MYFNNIVHAVLKKIFTLLSVKRMLLVQISLPPFSKALRLDLELQSSEAIISVCLSIILNFDGTATPSPRRTRDNIHELIKPVGVFLTSIAMAPEIHKTTPQSQTQHKILCK